MVETRVRPVRIEDEMRSSYLDYAMSVIVSRALPDVRDGLKPVHRRILYAIQELGMRSDTAHKKSARVVGEVLGKYHPHGDAAVYDAMVRMAQNFSMRYPLIDGQGNFGSIDADPPAAMRYTEVRMAAIAEEMLVDIDRDTVDFVPNFDGSLSEPTVLPARLPNLLVNGASGIAVGMATNIPPHNLSEVCDAIAHLIDHPEATVEDLLQFVQGPDFPSAGIILGRKGLQDAYSVGRGRIVMRARAQIEETRANQLQIVVTELPYQVNKASLVEKIAELVKDHRLRGIADLRDESDRDGIRIVMELRRDAQPRQVLNFLFKYTPMQSAFHVNALALVDGEPRLLPLKAIIQHYIAHRQQVVTRRSRHDLERAQRRAHVLEGLKIALDNLDEVIATVRRSQQVQTARTNLMQRFGLSEVQAQAILDLPLRRLAAMERERILDEYAEVLKTVASLEDLLASPRKILDVVKEEVVALKEKYGDTRRTLISDEEAMELTDEDLIPHQDVIVTLSVRGYIKRLPADTYRAQLRGGRGITGVSVRGEDDAIRHLVAADTHYSLFFFTNRGRIYSLRIYEVPALSRQSQGHHLQNLVALEPEERVTTVIGISKFGDRDFLVLVTRKGQIKKTPLSEFASVRANGKIAMNLDDGDELLTARLAGPQDDVILVTEKGQAARISVAEVSTQSRAAGGVTGIRLGEGDQVVDMDAASQGDRLLVVSANGFGKCTPISEYATRHRPWSGVITLNLIPKAGDVVAARVVRPEQEVLLISSAGQVLRTAVAQISLQGRATQGVTLMRLEPQERVAAIACINGDEDSDARP